jgi:hypothetical protein
MAFPNPTRRNQPGGYRMTIAQQIAAALENDGQQWRTRCSAPKSFWDLIEQHGGSSVDWRDGWQIGDVRSHTFSDGSVITVCGEAWDIGFPDCYCWAGAVEQEGHRCQEEEA